MDQLIGTHRDGHKDLHSEQGPLPGEHPGRSRNPVIKVADIAWLEFEKPDLTRTEAFARAFGFQTARRAPGELQLRGTDAGAPCVIVRRGQRTRFAGAAFRACDEVDVLRIADKSGATARPLPDDIGGLSVDLVDPSGTPVRVVAGGPHWARPDAVRGAQPGSTVLSNMSPSVKCSTRKPSGSRQ